MAGRDGQGSGTPPERRAIWIRGAYALLFLVAFEVAQIVLNLLAVVQFGFLVVTRRHNGHLERFGRSLAIWQAQVTGFVSCVTEDKPFPFAPWPDADG